MANSQAQIVAEACSKTIDLLSLGDYKMSELAPQVIAIEPLASQRAVAHYCLKSPKWRVIKLTSNRLVYRKELA